MRVYIYIYINNWNYGKSFPTPWDKDAASEVNVLNSGGGSVNNAWISRGSLYFLLNLFHLFVFFFVVVMIIFPLISVFWPHPGESSAFDFSLYGYMVNFLSHSSEMETFYKKLCTVIILHCSSCCLLFIAESEARLKRWQLLGALGLQVVLNVFEDLVQLEVKWTGYCF